MQKVWVVNWEGEGVYVYTSEDAAIQQVEDITGVPADKWSFDNGDTDSDGRTVWYREAEMQEDENERKANTFKLAREMYWRDKDN